MTLLNEANRIYIGTHKADAVYAGAVKVWPHEIEPPPDTYNLVKSYVPINPRYNAGLSLGVTFILTQDVAFNKVGYYCLDETVNGRYVVEVYAEDALGTGSPVISQMVDMTTATIGEWAYDYLPKTITLKAGVRYYLGTVTVGQGWSDNGAVELNFADPASVAAFFGASDWSEISGTFPDTMWVGLDLAYEEKLASTWLPTSLTGLEVWHDASQLTQADGTALAAWPNLGTGQQPVLTAFTPPVSVKDFNGLKLARFSAGGAGLRGRSTMTNDYTLVYLVRKWGPTAARAFSTFESNVLVGFHNVGYDVCHNSGWMPDFGVSWSGNVWQDNVWHLYGLDAAGQVTSNFYVSGTLHDTHGWTDGLGGTYGISGWQETTADESTDCDVAELLMYNRRLTDADRQAVEGYLAWKWGVQSILPVDHPYKNAAPT